LNQKKNTILIIEDEAPIRKVFTIALESAEYKVVECDNGKEGMRLAASINPELILLDLGLPDVNGKTVIASVREWSQVPIIVCSAQNADNEIIQALQAGADDYITKPFNPDVVMARIHANLRKAATAEAGDPEIANGHIRMDLVRHEVFLGDVKTLFTPKEYELLRYFLVHSGKMLTHRDILKAVWGNAHTDDMQYLRVYVRQLREKIEPDMSEPRYIITEPGIGYRMETLETPPAPAKKVTA
jgi:two-component system KDP operon response regulator KdpE